MLGAISCTFDTGHVHQIPMKKISTGRKRLSLRIAFRVFVHPAANKISSRKRKKKIMLRM